jgi:hypothetical protein
MVAVLGEVVSVAISEGYRVLDGKGKIVAVIGWTIVGKAQPDSSKQSVNPRLINLLKDDKENESTTLHPSRAFLKIYCQFPMRSFIRYPFHPPCSPRHRSGCKYTATPKNQFNHFASAFSLFLLFPCPLFGSVSSVFIREPTYPLSLIRVAHTCAELVLKEMKDMRILFEPISEIVSSDCRIIKINEHSFHR